MADGLQYKEDRYFKKLYSSKLRLSRRVLGMERRTAKTLCKLLSIPGNETLLELQTNLEWLLTWKLKTGCAPEIFWCDGVESIKFKNKDKRSVEFNADLWLGPESNDDIIKTNMSGKLVINASGKKLKSYCFNINYKGKEICAKKHNKSVKYTHFVCRTVSPLRSESAVYAGRYESQGVI